MSKTIYFDLDGTVYDLYNVPNWLEKLRREEPNIFLEGETISNLSTQTFTDVIVGLINSGYTFGVISWLPMYCTPEYAETCRQEKIKWCQRNLPFVPVENISIIPYGIPKQKAITKKSQIMWLIDDNKEVCEIWKTPKARLYKNVSENYSVYTALCEILVEEED